VVEGSARATEPLSVRLDLERGHVIAGRVEIPPELAPDEVIVSIRGEGADGLGRAHASLPTGPDGTFRVDVLPPGRYRVMAEAPFSSARYEARETVETGSEDVRLVLRRKR
jgi:hypothetical protein